MNDRFHRIRALIGDNGMAKLQNATVMVVGCGAVGSFAIESLARSGVGNLILIDFDSVDVTNINRQLFALTSTVGMKKTDVAAARVRDINPNISVVPMDLFFDENTELTVQPDFVIDAIDSVPSKIALYKWCRKNNVAFASSMGAARKDDISQIRVGRISKTSVCPLASKIRKLIRDTDIGDFPVVYSTQAPVAGAAPGRVLPSMVTVTGAFGLNLANIALQHLVGEKLSV